MNLSLYGQRRISMNISTIKNDFPFFKDNDLVYLDSGATAQKPQVVLDSMDNYYK